jgi:hypothetical protein
VGEEPDCIKRGQELRSNQGNVGKVGAFIVPIYLPIEKSGLRNRNFADQYWQEKIWLRSYRFGRYCLRLEHDYAGQVSQQSI